MFWFGHERKLKELRNGILQILTDNRDLDKRIFELDERLTNLSDKFRDIHCYDFITIRDKRIKVNNNSIKTWSNRFDVDVGDKGYGAFCYKQYKTGNPDLITIKKIDSDEYGCFISENDGAYPFFIPLKIVENA